jgi:pilus assembly protein TadC
MTGVAAAVGAFVVLAGVPWWGAGAAVRRRVRRLGTDSRVGRARGRAAEGLGEVDVSILLELLAAAVRAGAGVPRALRAVGDALGDSDGEALGRVADALRLGADWVTAWRGAPPRLDPVRRALSGAWEDGVAPGDALRAAREELQRERRAAARTAAARLSVRLVLPLGACYLPAFVLVGLVPVLLALGLDVVSG